MNVSTGQYILGHDRLKVTLAQHAPDTMFISWRDQLPPGSPSHREVPYAFKAYALEYAESLGFTQLLWADASIVPIRSLEPIWEQAAEHGAWVSDNGWSSADWCADAAYADLFPGMELEEARAINKEIKHPVATAFAVDLNHVVGRALLRDYSRLARTNAFKGPWFNSNYPGNPPPDAMGWSAACGPVTTRGHRHDQQALGVICSELGIPLTAPPAYFCYKGGEADSTILVATGIGQ